MLQIYIVFVTFPKLLLDLECVFHGYGKPEWDIGE